MKKILFLVTTLMCWALSLSSVNAADSYNINVMDIENGTIDVQPSAQAEDIVKVSILPDDGYELSEFLITKGTDKVVFNLEDSSFVMPEGDVVIFATFTETEESTEAYPITYIETEGGTFDGQRGAMYGENVIFAASPNEGYKLESISILYMGKENIAYEHISDYMVQFTMPDGEVVVSAVFSKEDLAINVVESANGVVIAPATAQVDDVVKFEIVPKDGYQLSTLHIYSGYNGSVDVEWNEKDSSFVMPTSEVTISATFTEISESTEAYPITYVETEGGTFDGQRGAMYGDNVIFAASPNEGYKLESITILYMGKEYIAYEHISDYTVQFTMPDGEVVVSAVFSKEDLAINVVESANGVVIAPATAQVDDVVKFEIVPKDGYQLSTLLIYSGYDGSEEIGWNEKDSSFVMPAYEAIIWATFTATSGVQDVRNNSIYTANGHIYCEGEFRIFDLFGHDVSGKNGSLMGVYVVRTKNGVEKVIVK